jgi:hypothetical protein
MKHFDARHHSAVVAAFIFQLVKPPIQITPIATDALPYETPAVAVGRVLRSNRRRPLVLF